MAEDRSKQMLNLYSKDGKKVISGVAGTKSVTVTGVSGGTVVAAGDYQVSYTDGKTESAKVDVPGFTVPVPVIAVTGVTVDPKTLSVEVGKTGTFSFTVAPANATDQKASVKSADDTKATATLSGTTVTVTGVAATEADKPINVTTTVGGKTVDVAVTVTTAAA